MDYSVQARIPWVLKVLQECINQGVTVDELSKAVSILADQKQLPPVGTVACVNLDEVDILPGEDIGTFFARRREVLERSCIYLTDEDYLEMW